METSEIFKKLGEAVVPIKYQERIKLRFMTAGFADLPLRFLGGVFLADIFIVILAFVFVFLVYLDFSVLLSIASMLALFLALAILEFILIYLYLDIKIYKRTREIEDHLDKFLQQVSDNLKGGMTFDKALWDSARIEFGALSQEIKMVAKTATTGKDIDTSLRKFMEKYKSPIIKRTFSLIAESIKGGGKITNILDRIVIDLKEAKKLNKEMKTAVLNYIIFISVIVMVIAPGLFAVAGQLLKVLTQFIDRLATSLTSSGTSIPFNVTSVAISSKDFMIFSLSSLAVISIFSGMIIAIITKGKIKSGLKYIPIFLVVSILSYLLIHQFFSAVFSSLV